MLYYTGGECNNVFSILESASLQLEQSKKSIVVLHKENVRRYVCYSIITAS